MTDRAVGRVNVGRPRTPRFLAVDFFCGAGGTTNGLIQSGGYVIAGVDKDGSCKRTYLENNANIAGSRKPPEFLQYDVFPKSSRYQEGQQKELFDRLENLIVDACDRFPGVPLLFAICAPCQPFTRISRAPMKEETRVRRKKDQNLLSESCKFIEFFEPELVFAENVSSIKNKKYGGVWNRFANELRRQGYVLGSKTVCTSRFGIPQYRKRSILIGACEGLVSDDSLADFDEPRLIVPEGDPDESLVSVKEAIGHLPSLSPGSAHPRLPNHRARNVSKINRKRLNRALPGKTNNYLFHGEGDLALPCQKRLLERSKERGFHDVYTRMSGDKPSPTITTKAHSISNGRFAHYDTRQTRGLSPREAAILQSFPSDYMFYPTDQIEPVMRMIGNAVPPKLARYYADFLVGALN